MLEHLAKLLKASCTERPWLRQTHCVRCFLHVVNLIAQTLLWQFDSPRCKGSAKGEGRGNGTDELREQCEQHTNKAAILNKSDNELEPDEDESNNTPRIQDDPDGWVDELAEMGEWDQDMHAQYIAPLRLTVVKVHCFSAYSPSSKQTVHARGTMAGESKAIGCESEAQTGQMRVCTTFFLCQHVLHERRSCRCCSAGGQCVHAHLLL